jgi:RimJ/RimL family protein N-acetyltransferase
MADFQLETDRLVLRAWRDSDLDALCALCADPEVMRYLGPLQSRQELAAALARQQGYQRHHGYSFWPIERRDDGLFLGFCGLQPGAEGTPVEGAVEIGWRLRADAWGKGYAREAAVASLAWAWAGLGTPEVVAITNIGNTRSRGLMERLGMTRDPGEDFDHPALPEDNPLRPHILYRIRRPR